MSRSFGSRRCAYLMFSSRFVNLFLYTISLHRDKDRQTWEFDGQQRSHLLVRFICRVVGVLRSRVSSHSSGRNLALNLFRGRSSSFIEVSSRFINSVFTFGFCLGVEAVFNQEAMSCALFCTEALSIEDDQNLAMSCRLSPFCNCMASWPLNSFWTVDLSVRSRRS